MKRILVGLIIGLLSVSTAEAQVFDLMNDTLFEPLIGSQTLHNGRAVSLGGAVTASVQDGSALWYNPAALARIPRLEISGDLIHNRIKGESEPLSLTPLAIEPTVTPTELDARHTRLGSAYLVLPVPTYRGALTVAGGVTVTNNLDRVMSGRLDFAPGTFVDTLGYPPDTLITEQIEDYRFGDRQQGVVRAWQVGFGIDVSPRLSLGLSGVYYDGKLDLTSNTTFLGTRTEGPGTPATSFPVRWDFSTTSHEQISGWGANLGLLYRPRNTFSVGAVIRSPVEFTIDLDQLYTEQRDLGTVNEFPQSLTTRKLQLPFAFTAGLAWLYNDFLFAADVSYTDWSQTEYTDTPVLTRYNDQFGVAYREQVSLGGGIEWVIPSSATTLRGGVRWAQLPYAERLVVDNILTLSGGVGFLIDQVMAIDLAVAHQTARGGNPVFGFDEKYSRTRVILTTAYRL